MANVIKDAIGQVYDIKEGNSSASKDVTENAEKKLRKERQLEAFRRIYGIWKDRSDIDAIFKELDERWKQ